MILQSGEKYTQGILRRIYAGYDIVNVYRQRTMSKCEFGKIMRHIYSKLNPSNIERTTIKAEMQGLHTSFLLVVCKGSNVGIKEFKTSIRKLVGVNCFHSSDDTASTLAHLNFLVGCGKDEAELDKKAKINFDEVEDFSYYGFLASKPTRCDQFSSLCSIFKRLGINNITYAVLNVGPLLEENVRNKKDIEFICANRVQVIDILGAVTRHKKNKYGYILKVNGEKVKVDFGNCGIPDKWRNHVLATRILGSEGFYQPTDIDRFWLTIWERTVQKPDKWKQDSRYGEGAKWADIIRWGRAMGISTNLKTVEDCRAAVFKYISYV